MSHAGDEQKSYLSEIASVQYIYAYSAQDQKVIPIASIVNGTDRNFEDVARIVCLKIKVLKPGAPDEPKSEVTCQDHRGKFKKRLFASYDELIKHFEKGRLLDAGLQLPEQELPMSAVERAIRSIRSFNPKDFFPNVLR